MNRTISGSRGNLEVLRIYASVYASVSTSVRAGVKAGANAGGVAGAYASVQTHRKAYKPFFKQGRSVDISGQKASPQGLLEALQPGLARPVFCPGGDCA